MDGFLLINKPAGLTSHDVVFKIKKKFHIDKVGHTGTLDPFASGVMILCLGKATKLAYFFESLDKAYEGTIVFGAHYDTYDTTGKIIDTKAVTFSQDQLNEKVASFIGTYDQIPPMYSALKQQGKKLYELARSGQTVERDARKVTVSSFEVIAPLAQQKFDFRVFVSKGTYIRSLAVDLAESLNTFGALERLVRTRVGTYDLSEAKTLENVTKDDIITLEKYVALFPVIELNDYMIKLVRNGVYLDQRQTTLKEPFIVLDQAGEKVALYDVLTDKTYKPVIIF